MKHSVDRPCEHISRPAGGACAHGSRKDARVRLRLTLALTGSIFLAELLGGFYSGSLALLSDAGHMLSDLGSLLVSFFALLIAQRPANPRKTYGYYRAEILAALGNALALLPLTGFIVYEAIQRFMKPRDVLAGPMLAVATVGLLANIISLRVLHAQLGNLNVRSAYLHVLGDLVSSVGVIVCGVVMLFTRLYILDPIVSLFIAVLIIVGAYRVLREAIDILLEASPAGIDCAEVELAMLAVRGACEVHDLHIWSITSGMVALSGHVIVAPEQLADAHRILDALKHVLLDRFGIDHTTIQIEPEGYEHVGEVHAAHACVE